jgi:hypothetical protein
VRGAEDVIVHPYAGKDREGVDSWGADVLLERAGIPYPRSSDDLEEGGTIVGENVFIPGDIGATITSKDNITLRGVRYRVEGRPADLRKSGRRKGVLVQLGGVV